MKTIEDFDKKMMQEDNNINPSIIWENLSPSAKVKIIKDGGYSIHFESDTGFSEYHKLILGLE